MQNVYYIIHNSIHEELLRQKKLGPFAYRYLLKSKKNLSGKQLISVSKGIEKEINNSELIKPASVTTIYNPFDIDNIQQLALQPSASIPETSYVIHVGRLAKQKRHDVLFQAFKKVDPKYKLVLLTNNPKKAQKLAVKFGIDHRLILPGFQENPYNWIKKAELLVLSSDYEGFGNVIAEALIVGTKVVSTDCPHGPNEILTGELAKYLVPRRNILRLAERMNNALNANIDLTCADILPQIAVEYIAKQYLALTES